VPTTIWSVAQPGEHAPLAHTVVRGAGLAGLGFFLTYTITLSSYVVFARLAPPKTFGTFAAAGILIAGATLFAESGMTAAVVQRRDRLEAAAATAFVSTLAGGALLSLLALLVSPAIGALFRSTRIGEVAAVLSPLLFLHAAPVVPAALLQRRMSLRPRLIVEPVAAVAQGVVTGIALASGLGVWGLVLGTYAWALTRAIALWSLAGWRPRIGQVSWTMWRELVRYARHLVASEALRESSGVGTTALVGRVLGTAPLGQFRYASRLATTGASLTTIGAYILFPALARIAPDEQRFRGAFRRSLRVAAIAIFPVSFMFLVLGEPIMVLVFGEVWRQAGRILMALSGITAAAALISVASETAKAVGRPYILPRIHALSGLLPIALIVAFLPFGPVGVGAAISIGSAIAAAYAITKAATLANVPLRQAWGELVSPAVASAVAAGLVAVLNHLFIDVAERPEAVGLGLLLVELILGAACYLIVLRKLSPEAASEIARVRRLLAPRLRPASRSHARELKLRPRLEHADLGKEQTPATVHAEPTFSIVMPAYNACATIAPAIESVLRQTRGDFELIVVNDGSTDETVARVEPYLADRRIRVISQPNLGLAGARNTAIAASRGTYVSLLDSDDLWLPQYLEVMAAALDADSTAGVAYTDAWVLDDVSRRIGRVSAMSPWHPPSTPEAPEQFLRALLEWGNYVFVGATIRRRVLADVGTFRTGVQGSEDYELWLRIAAHGYRFVRCPPNLAIYRWSAGQMSADVAAMLRNGREVFRIVAEEYDVPDDLRELARLRMHQQEQRLKTLNMQRPRRVPRLLRRPYRTLSRLRHFYLMPPSEVRKAFPDLARGDRA
jgi:O-antigen/teichoic acid export membrane protein/glycosyltransferase involved in cell wall biosynthesis